MALNPCASGFNDSMVGHQYPTTGPVPRTRGAAVALVAAFVLAVLLNLALPSAEAHDGMVKQVADAAKSIRIEADLVIGVEDGDSNSVLGRVFDVAVNSSNDIFILDNGFSRVRRFSSDGRHVRNIGREGQGPGEFSFPTAIHICDGDSLYVADLSRVTIFDPDGEYVSSFRYLIPDGFVRSIRTTADGDILISCFDVFERTVVHRYDRNGERIQSFCRSYAADREEDVRKEQQFSGGSIDLDSSGQVLYTQMVPPYEIRRYSASGRLLTVLRRDTAFLQPPVFRVEGDVIIAGMPSGHSSIVSLPSIGFLNVAWNVVDADSQQTMLDVYGLNDGLLASQVFDYRADVRCVDSRGRIYVILTEDFPRVARCTLTIE